jgi:hypothetical protein
MHMESKRKPSFANIFSARSARARRLVSFGQVGRGAMLGAPYVRKFVSARVVPPEIGMSVLKHLQASNFCVAHATTGCARCMASNISFKADGCAAA